MADPTQRITKETFVERAGYAFCAAADNPVAPLNDSQGHSNNWNSNLRNGISLAPSGELLPNSTSLSDELSKSGKQVPGSFGILALISEIPVDDDKVQIIGDKASLAACHCWLAGAGLEG
ncbi:hypothetical protein [Aestuariivirga sp.]|uniref:hypothetical protein n=1 Tax=Aestuariivirga sp. TaxID=2650926 RepID=UPI00391A944C